MVDEGVSYLKEPPHGAAVPCGGDELIGCLLGESQRRENVRKNVGDTLSRGLTAGEFADHILEHQPEGWIKGVAEHVVHDGIFFTLALSL